MGRLMNAWFVLLRCLRGKSFGSVFLFSGLFDLLAYTKYILVLSGRSSGLN